MTKASKNFDVTNTKRKQKLLEICKEQQTQLLVLLVYENSSLK